MNIGDTNQMQVEYEAWQSVVREWNSIIGDSMNEPKFNTLIAAIRMWAEELVLLRESQEPDVCDTIREQAVLEYDRCLIP